MSTIEAIDLRRLLCILVVNVIAACVIVMLNSAFEVLLIFLIAIGMLLSSIVIYKQFGIQRDIPYLAWGFRVWLLALLAMYALFDKGAAHLHLTVYGVPLYIGEIVLIVGVFSFLYSKPRNFTGIELLFLLFAVWGLSRTIPLISKWGLDAIRDSAIYYYGFFMIFIQHVIRTRKDLIVIFQRYKSLVPFIVFIPGAFYIARLAFGLQPPAFPNTVVPLVLIKGGDLSVQLGAVMVALLLCRKGELGYSIRMRLVLFIPATISLLAAVSISRSGMVAAVLGIGIYIAATKRVSILVYGLVLSISCGAIITMLPILAPQKEDGRHFSVQQIEKNMSSIQNALYSDKPNAETEGSLRGTMSFRTELWKKIVSSSFSGFDFFFFGCGFGPNMFENLGYTMGPDEAPARSPHNFHLNVLYRMGVPGLLLWTAINVFYFLGMVRCIRKADSSGDRFFFSVSVWVTCFWAMALVVATFDVYLEGPMGGIWYWSVLGVGIAIMKIQRRTDKERNSHEELWERNDD